MVRTFRMLGGLAAAFWLISGVLAILKLVDLGVSPGTRFLGVLMVGNGIAVLLSSILSLRGHRWLDILALGVLGANGVLSVADQVGPLDLVSLGVSAALVGMLLAGIRRDAAGSS